MTERVTLGCVVPEWLDQKLGPNWGPCSLPVNGAEEGHININTVKSATHEISLRASK